MKIDLEAGSVDLVTGVVEREGGRARLTRNERLVLSYLVDRPFEDVSRDTLLGDVLGVPDSVITRSLDVLVARLRRKLEHDPRSPIIIVTAHGCGYRYLPAAVAPVSNSKGVVRQKPAAWDLRAGSLRFFFDRAVVMDSEGYSTDLTPQELLVVKALAEAPGMTLDVRELALRVVGRATAKRAVSSTVHRLRQKLRMSDFIESVRGIGYRLNAEKRTVIVNESGAALESVAQCVTTVLGLVDCMIYVRDGEQLRQWVACDTQRGFCGKVVEPLVLEFGRGIVGACAESGEAQLVADTKRDPRYVPDTIPGRSEMCVPVVHAARVVAVVDSESPDPSAFSPQDVNRLAAMVEIAKGSFLDRGSGCL